MFNRREDEYGGSFENRTQMLLRVIRAVRKAVGDDIAVGLKYNGSDFLGDQGWTIEDSCRFAPLAEEAGVDYITITAGLVGTPQLTIPPMYEPQGCYSDLAAAVRPFATVPIGTIGRIKNPLKVALLGVTVNIILPGRFDTNRVRELDGNRARRSRASPGIRSRPRWCAAFLLVVMAMRMNSARSSPSLPAVTQLTSPVRCCEWTVAGSDRCNEFGLD